MRKSRFSEEQIIGSAASFSAPVHPLQVYLGVWSIFVGAVSLCLLPRRAFEGQVFLAYLVLAGVGKVFLENLRHGHLPHVQYGSLISVILAGVLLVLFSVRSSRSKKSV